MRTEAWEKFEELQHSTANGFYCTDADMYFEDLGEWLDYHGYSWADVSN